MTHKKEIVETPRGKFFQTAAAPLAGCVLGIAHGCGANAPSLWWLQLLSMTLVLAISFLATSNKLLAVSVLTALAFSLASSAAAHAWIFMSLARDSSLGLPLGSVVFAALIVLLALLPAVSIAVGSAFVTGSSYARLAPVILALGYPLAELGTSEVIGFSWHSIGYSPLGTPLDVLLPIFGVEGVAAVSMLTSALVAFAWLRWWRSPASAREIPWRGVVFFSSILIGLALLQRTSYYTVTRPLPHALHVRLLQPALPLHRKFDTALMRSTARQLETMARDPVAHLIVAPETVLPHSWATMPTDLSAPLMNVVTHSDRLLLIGLFDISETGGLLNVSAALDAKSLSIPPPQYSKRHLVPVAEEATRGLGWISDALALPYANRVAGDGDATVFTTAYGAIRTSICLDLAYGGDFAASADVTTLLVNQSNLAALPGERVRAQFVTIARARAAEQRKPLLLVSNDGPTAAIDADGRVLASLPGGVAAGLSATVQPRQGRTPYALLGESSWIVLLVFAGLGLLIRLPARRNQGVALNRP